MALMCYALSLAAPEAIRIAIRLTYTKQTLSNPPSKPQANPYANPQRSAMPLPPPEDVALGLSVYVYALRCARRRLGKDLGVVTL